MKFELRRLEHYSPETIVEEIQRVAKLIPQQKLSRTVFRKHSRVSPSTIDRHFGTWEDALRAAGLADRYDSSNQLISEDEVLNEIRRVATELGVNSLSRLQFNSHARFTYDVVRSRFGSWHKAMRAAGLETNPLGKRYTDSDCFENLLAVWTHYGRAPTHSEMSKPPSIVGPKAYVRRFGTWMGALQAFVEKVNSEMPLAPLSDDDNQVPTNDFSPSSREENANEADRREIRLGLRYAILSRDLFRCVVCGRSPATHLGVALHVDHILPVARGGKTVFDNLRTLCGDCNLGKGAKIDSDTSSNSTRESASGPSTFNSGGDRLSRDQLHERR